MRGGLYGTMPTQVCIWGRWWPEEALKVLIKRKGIREPSEETYTYTFDDGSTIDHTIQTVFKDIVLAEPRKRNLEDHELHDMQMPTNRFEIDDWPFDDKTFSSIRSAKRHIDNTIKKLLKEHHAKYNNCSN